MVMAFVPIHANQGSMEETIMSLADVQLSAAGPPTLVRKL